MSTIRSVLLASGAALLLSAGIAAAAPATAEINLNVRAGPGTRYPVVGAIQSGETVDVRGCTGGWCRVRFPGGSGFASRSHLAMAGGRAVGVAVTRGYAPGYAYEDYPGYAYTDYPAYAYDDYYDYGYGYGPSVGVGFAFGGRFHRHRFDHHWGGYTGAWQGRPGGWQNSTGTASFQGPSGFSGGRVGGAAPGSVTSMSRGGPGNSAPAGLGGGAAASAGARAGAQAGGGAVGGGANVGGAAGGSVRR